MTRFLFWTTTIIGLTIISFGIIPIILIASLGWLGLMVAFLIRGL
jgi:hypothetical protein